MLAALGCRYGTDDATNFSIEVHKLLALEAYRSSVNLAKERGPSLFMIRAGKKIILLSSV